MPEQRPGSPLDTPTVVSETDIVDLRDEDEQNIAEDASLKKYTAWNCKRNEERAKLEAEAEEVWEFKVGETLRQEWASAQRRDSECQRALRDLKNTQSKPKGLSLRPRQEGLLARTEREMFRIAEDGVLERKIVATHLGQPEWLSLIHI